MPLSFEWDEQKARTNLRKHGVSFEEATTVFGDPLSRTISDPLHSDEENRFVIIGRSFINRLLVVIYTERGDNIRIIAAREATSREKKAYAENEE